MVRPRGRVIAFYARVSTRAQSPASQLMQLTDAVADRGWGSVPDTRWYVDVHTGASRGPQLMRLLADARARKFNCLGVQAFDRIARSAADLLWTVDELTSVGVEFWSLREGWDTSTPVGRATLTIIAAVAELERSVLSERVRAGLDRAAREGRYPGRPRRDLDTDRIRDLVDRGRSQRQIAQALGIPRTTLRRTLRELDD